MGLPAPLNLDFVVGATWRQQIGPITDSAGDVVDLTGFTIAMEVRDAPGGTVVATFTAETGHPSHLLTGGVWVGRVAPAATAPVAVGDYRFDIKMTDPAGDVEYLIAGGLEAHDRITT